MAEAKDDKMDSVESLRVELKSLADEIRNNRAALQSNHADYLRGLNGVQERIEKRLSTLENQLIGDGSPSAIFSRVRELETHVLALQKERELDRAKMNTMDGCIDRLETHKNKWTNIAVGISIAWPIILGLLWYIFNVLNS